MSAASQALVAEFEAAATAAQQAEEALRKKMAAEVAHLERQRAFAFRRMRLVRILTAAAMEQASEEAAVAAQRCGVRDDLGWSGTGEAHEAILARLQPVGRAVWQCTCGADGGTPHRVGVELKAFEDWFEAEHGKSFYALYDQYFPEVPVVDF